MVPGSTFRLARSYTLMINSGAGLAALRDRFEEARGQCDINQNADVPGLILLPICGAPGVGLVALGEH